MHYLNENSKILKVNCGVPQGSILGPLLFLIYVNDLFLACPDCFCLLFADDTNLFFTDKDFETLICRTNTTLNLVTKWFYVNKLSLNVDKTNFMIYHTKKRKRNNADINVKINNCNIGQVCKVKFLGVWMDEQLTWKSHIIYISNKISKVIGILKKVRQSVSSKVLRNLYYALVYPYYTYCNITWACNYKSNLDCLVKLQKKIVRVISFSEYNAHTDQLFIDYNIMKFVNLNIFLTGMFMYKVNNGLFPRIIQNIFVSNVDIHSYNTRQKYDYHIFPGHTNLSLFSIKYHGPKIWNQLPEQLRKIVSYHLFKRKLKQYYLS